MGLLSKVLKKAKKETSRPVFCSAVVVAGGQASRMKGLDKIMTPLGEEPLILHTLAPFQASELVDEIILVAREDLMVPIGNLCSQKGFTKVRRVVKGGESRPQSVLAGLKETDPASTHVAIHDGARPFVTEELLETVIQAARRASAAAPAIPVKDTIKRAKDRMVLETPDRAELFAVQTPQVFDRDLIVTALSKAIEEGAAITDDCSAVERIGFPVLLTQGSEENIKITTPADLLHGMAILTERAKG